MLLRLLQGLALGGEYGGAAVYVAEHAPDDKRGYYTSFIQTTATLGLFISLIVILVVRRIGWRRCVQAVGLENSVPALDRPRRDVVLHTRAAEGVAAVLTSEGSGEDLDRADS